MLVGQAVTPARSSASDKFAAETRPVAPAVRTHVRAGTAGIPWRRLRTYDQPAESIDDGRPQTRPQLSKRTLSRSSTATASGRVEKVGDTTAHEAERVHRMQRQWRADNERDKEPPKVFISYSWSGTDHELFVMELATALQKPRRRRHPRLWRLKVGKTKRLHGADGHRQVGGQGPCSVRQKMRRRQTAG